MKKLIALSLLLLSSCAMTVPKDSFVNYTYNLNMGARVFEKQQEWAYCFGLDEKTASEDITNMWKDAVLVTEKEMPDKIQNSDVGGYHTIMGKRLDDAFWEKHHVEYLPDTLTAIQVSNCRKIVGR